MATSIKTSGIDLNVPAKVIPVTVLSLSAYEYWDYDDGEGDKWWSGGINPKPYRWEAILEIEPISHGSHLTRSEFTFNGLDIHVGDMLAGSTDGKTVQIISISSKTETSCTCIVEDLLRYNTFRNPSGSGVFTAPGQAIVFQINEFGEPIIDPLPTGIVSSDFYPNIDSRFKYLNMRSNFVLEKTNHGFEDGDVIAISDDGEFQLSNASNLKKLIGTVSHAGPGPDQFMLRPFNGLIDLVPSLPGTAGDFIYASTDGSGDLTTVETGAPIFLNIRDAIPTVIKGTVLDGTTSVGAQFELNGELITTTGTTITDVANDINLLESSHGVHATSEPSPTVAVSDSGTYGSAYGLVGGFPPFSASINGTTVNFTTTIEGFAAYGQNVAIADDMAFDINQAAIPGIVAHASAGLLYITETGGGAINIVNITNDINSNPFAGTNSITSMNTTYAASTGQQLTLTRSNGGEVLLINKVGTALEDFGIISGHNGCYPIGLNVEQGIRVANMYVVPNIAGRDAISNPIVGDQAYVIDTDEGEWGMYLWDGTQWVVTATEDSAATDANSLYHEYVAPLASDPETTLMGRISDTSRVVSVMIEVVTPVSGGSLAPTINVGTLATPDLLVSENLVDLESAGSYGLTPDYYYSGVTELELYTTINLYGATAGDIKVTITYV